MPRWLTAEVVLVWASLGLLSFTAGNAYAGDEVDYSAPYLTLENGELVTKYPAKEHSTDDAGMPASPHDIAEPPRQSTNLLLLGFALATIFVAGVVRRLRNGRSKRQAEEADQAG